MNAATRVARGPLIALCLVAVMGCKGKPDEAPWCSDARQPISAASQPVTWHRDIQPITAAKCAGCHVTEGLGPFSLQRYEDFAARGSLIGNAVLQRHMPPWLADRCCAEYRNDFSLTEAELSTFQRWLSDGMPEGSPQDAPTPRPISGLSRVDVTVRMAEDFVPQPPSNGGTDELRCFVIDWPLDKPVYITGLNPRPGNRAIVHHLIVGAVSSEDAEPLREREGHDGRPGFDCTGGFGGVRNIQVLGGSLVGSDYPEGIGTRIEPGSKIVLNVHYSMAFTSASPDRTAIEFRVDDEARPAKSIVIANPAWLVGDAMKIEAGDPDAVFWFQFRPTLFTANKRVHLRSVTPHMHAFATRFTLRILREDGSRQCLLEIPHWDFGWEQPFWFAQPITLEPEDQLYVECHFDNSAARQPPGQEPRDIAWGESNQDMCAGFLSFTEEP